MSDDIFANIDMSDPCVVWPKLEEVLTRLLAGQMVVRGRFDQDEQEFQRVDIEALQRRIHVLKAECAGKQGGRPRRRAITFG